MAKEKPWSGRFTESTDAAVEAFTASVEFDQRLYVYDIMGSIAHAQMLAKVGVLTKKESDTIVKGLKDIEAEIDTGQFEWSVALEDVHMNIEARLIQRIGETGKKLHTGRSRNDQVATDLRLYLRDGIDVVTHSLGQLQQAILDLAEREAGSPMPGFTHLQVAQPITFGHHMLAWFEMLARDAERLQDCRGRVNVMPLGSAALAGTSFPIDRSYTAKLLGFEAPSENSLDAVADRDFVIEFVADAALIMTHLSRMAEELVLWSSAQFGFVELSDAYCTGSSIMPQKKNPDVPELVRGKTGRVTGHLVALLTLMKAQPLAYNKDNQEDKEPVFDTLDTVLGSLRVFTGMITSMKVRRDHLLRAAVMGHATATDLADYLVRQGVPFRDAHEIVGKAVRLALDTDRDLSQIDLEEYKKLSPAIGKDVYGVLTVEGSLKARDHLGGTAPSQVKAAIKRARTRLKKSGP
ncbi:MAG: argininosuccinate lyase [Gammaproteobacteria bacterium]|nr:argininosuccinate lyase [Gammaproteobacteria bacterium]MDH3371705.1 argininosuccinate lyase [Gammaproteobacteria bacterium]MDH3405783.1 argininosuccinate lyase [Gammaproteobacteria bacterium]